MLKVLLVEDHRDLAATVCEFLEEHEITVDYAHNCSLAKTMLEENDYHVLIFDINLPDGDGYSLCRYSREQLGLNTPIVMLTARDSLEDRLTGFDAGTDDYLIKPFDLPELVARIHALDNRARGTVGNAIFTVDDLSLDVKNGTVERAGTAITLSPIGFKILALLMRESPRIIKRSELELHIWGEELPDSDSLRSHIYTLRKAIDKPFEKALLKTKTGVGIKIDAS